MSQSQNQLDNIPLGKTTEYPQQYDASILYPVPRKLNRDSLGLTTELPFFGQDIWHGYELSWLNSKGKPQVALARFYFPFDSINIVESKSFKLYLNSFNQSRFESFEQVKQILISDLTQCAQGEVNVELFKPDQLTPFTPTALNGHCIDELDISIDDFEFNPAHLTLAKDNNIVTETLNSHLLKSNCLITNQPDWASVEIAYQGQAICHEGLLRYLISMRQHNEFHEQCVERIFNDIWSKLKPQKLSVIAYYTRRGGLDINPYRSSEPQMINLGRINRQ